jgi:PKD repeat protein
MTAATYSWNTGSTLPDITIDSTGRYILTVTDGAGCTVMDTTRAGKPKPVELGDDGILCGTTLFSGYNINEGKILWSTGDTTGNISLSMPGEYWVMVEETNGCMLSDTIDVTAFENIPSVMLGPDLSACEEATLMANITGAQYLWNTGDTTQQIKATLTGSYWVQVTNTAGCVGGDTLNVNITRKPSALFSFMVNMNDPAKVNFFNLSSLGGSPSSISFEWFFGDGGRDSNINTSHTYLDSGTYTVRLIVTTNCGADTFEQVVMIDIPVGIEDIIDPQEVAIFPNPATNALYIRFKKEVPKPFFLSMYDAQGRLVEQRQLTFATKDETLTFEVSTLAKGMYYLRFAGGLQGSQRVMLIR